VGILLAGGAATRFGRDKLLEPLPGGRRVACASARALLAALDRVLAVVRPGSERLAEVLRDCGADVVECLEAERGMGHSLACGVRASAGAAGWVVALADMPFVQPETVAAVVRALASGAAIARPTHRGRPGHPVGFAARFGPELAALRGDRGARWLVEAHRTDVLGVPCEDAGCVRDVDRPDDLG
jgi:molybdenum cofactor cytidylyltransferase